MSVPFPHPASHCGSRSELVMCHNPNPTVNTCMRKQDIWREDFP